MSLFENNKAFTSLSWARKTPGTVPRPAGRATKTGMSLTRHPSLHPAPFDREGVRHSTPPTSSLPRPAAASVPPPPPAFQQTLPFPCKHSSNWTDPSTRLRLVSLPNLRRRICSSSPCVQGKGGRTGLEEHGGRRVRLLVILLTHGAVLTRLVTAAACWHGASSGLEGSCKFGWLSFPGSESNRLRVDSCWRFSSVCVYMYGALQFGFV